MRQYSDYGYYAVAFYNTLDERILPDWDSSLKIEFRDSEEKLRFTATVSSTPSLQQGTDSDGSYVYVNNIDLSGWALGNVETRVYAKKEEVNIEPYPLYGWAFEVITETTPDSVFPGEITSPDLLADLRDYLRDKPELNRIIADYETKAASFIQSIQKAVSRINSTPPLGVCNLSIQSAIDSENNTYYILNYPADFKHILMDGIILEILKSLLYYKNRNTLNYTDGNISIQEENLSAHLNIYRLHQQEFTRELMTYKQAKNISSLLSGDTGLGSDYSYFYSTQYYEFFE